MTKRTDLWTTEQCRCLTKMWDAGEPLPAIRVAIAELGRDVHVQSIICKRKALGLPGRKADIEWTPAMEDRVSYLWNETNETQKRIAEIMTQEFPPRKFTRHSIGGFKHRMGLIERRPGLVAKADRVLEVVPAASGQGRPEPTGCVWPNSVRPLRYCGAETSGHDWCLEHRERHLLPRRDAA